MHGGDDGDSIHGGGGAGGRGSCEEARQQTLRRQARELFLQRAYTQRLLISKPDHGMPLAASPPWICADDWTCSERHVLELAALAFEVGSSKIRKRAQLYLRHGRLIQAVRLLLHTDDITRSALEQEPTTETFDEASYAGAATTEDMDAAVQCPIVVPSLEAAAAAVGMKPCVSMTLAMKRELNMRI